MGDPRRFDLLAGVVQKNFSRQYRVADVAGGKGYLNLALSQRGFEVTTFDKRAHPIRKINYHHRFFDESVTNDYNILVGMHPDEATDLIIKEANRRHIPFVIVPCCVRPFVEQFRGNYKYSVWFDHLVQLAERLGFQVQTFHLQMTGRNNGIIGRLT